MRVVTEKNRLASCTLDLGYSAKLSSSVGLPGSNNDTVKTFCRAMLCISADYAVMRCLCVCVCVCACVCVSVRFVNSVETSNRIVRLISRGSNTPTGTRITGASNARGYEQLRFSINISLYL